MGRRQPEAFLTFDAYYFISTAKHMYILNTYSISDNALNVVNILIQLPFLALL